MMIDRGLLPHVLKTLLKKEVKQIEGNWFLAGETVVRVCYSKVFPRMGYDRYFFGVQKDKYEQYKKQGLDILFICGDLPQALLVPNSVLDNFLSGVAVANDNNWKFDIHKTNNQFELIVTGKKPLNISSYRINLAPEIKE